MQDLENAYEEHRQRLRSIAGDVLSILPEKVQLRQRPSLDYQSNLLYDARGNGQHLILKEYLKLEEFGEAPVREFNALNLLADLDIAPQPRAYFPHHENNKPVVVYDYLDGRMWDRYRPKPAELSMLAQSWTEVNNLGSDGLWLSRGQEVSIERTWERIWDQILAYQDWVESDFKPAFPALELLIAVFDNRRSEVDVLAADDVPLCFCRSDPRFANVISRPDGRLGLVDWEDSGLRDPAKDLADIINHPNQEDLLSPIEWRNFLDPYLDYRGQHDSNLNRRFHHYLGLFPVWWLAILITEGLQQIVNSSMTE